jgi:anhydro-N-acetylmuramic acid kinase
MRTALPVVSNFRVADLANGGKGAPLVPFLDYLLFRHPTRGRIVQNIGGIANLTAMPAGAAPEQVMAFDTGPGNMVIDALAQHFFGRAFDRDGRYAARGTVNEEVLRWALSLKFFRQRPPKTAGREEFGREFVSNLLDRARRIRPEDALATATALTARTIADAIRRFVLQGKHSFGDYFVSGGGSRNRTLMRMLHEELQPLALRILTTDAVGLPSAAKEAVAFAVLAYQTWHREPANIPSATGARRPAILGKISYA